MRAFFRDRFFSRTGRLIIIFMCLRREASVPPPILGPCIGDHRGDGAKKKGTRVTLGWIYNDRLALDVKAKPSLYFCT